VTLSIHRAQQPGNGRPSNVFRRFGRRQGFNNWYRNLSNSNSSLILQGSTSAKFGNNATAAADDDDDAAINEPVDVVPEEKIVGFWRISVDVEVTQQVGVLAMDVATDRYWDGQLQQHWLIEKY